MDTQLPNIEAALTWAQYQTTLNNQRQLLKERFESDCVLAYNGGLFKITQAWLGGFNFDSAWALDSNELPIRVLDSRTFYNLAQSAYTQALETYGEAYEALRRQRKVRGLTEL
jgi:hypothetical protein